MILLHVHELRNERAEEHQDFRVRKQHQESLQEKSATRRRWRRVRIDVFARGTDQLDAEPDQIGRARKAHPVEPVTHGRHQRGQPDRDDADHDRKAGLRAGAIDQRRASAMPQAVGDQQRDHRTRQQRQRDAGGDESEIGLKGHGGTRWEGDGVIMHDRVAREKRSPPLLPLWEKVVIGGLWPPFLATPMLRIGYAKSAPDEGSLSSTVLSAVLREPLTRPRCFASRPPSPTRGEGTARTATGTA